MAQIIKLKRSSVSGNIPSTGSIVLGELAVNTADGKLFLKQSGSSGEKIVPLFSIGVSNTGSAFLTGSLLISGSVIIDGNVTASDISASIEGINITFFSASISSRVSSSEGNILVLEQASSSFSIRVTNLEATASNHESRITALESASFATGTLWTGSGDGSISRESDVKVTGSLDVTQTVSSSRVEVDDFSIHGTTTQDLLYQSGSGDIEFIPKPSVSGSVLQYNGITYVWSEIIDGGSF